MSKTIVPSDVLAARVSAIKPFHVMALLAQAQRMEAAGRSIIHLEIGEPDFPTPPAIIRAGMTALAQGSTQYTAALGLSALRTAISAFYRDFYHVDISRERVIVTPGASGALLLALSLFIEPGTSLMLADPGYPCNRHMAMLLGGAVQSIPVGADSQFQLTAAHIEQHWQQQTRVALVASPANPTGTVLSPSDIAALGDAVRARKGVLIVDEIYQGLVYATPPTSALAVCDDAIVVNSFSKYFGMTGWRLGWMIAPERFVPAIERLAQNLFLAASTPAQHAALAAFEPECLAELARRRDELCLRRDYLMGALRELGFVIPVAPGGAFYIYADCSAFAADSFSFAEQLLEQEGVAITPGLDFGEHQSSRYVRFAYATPIPQLQEAVARIRRFVGNL